MAIRWLYVWASLCTCVACAQHRLPNGSSPLTTIHVAAASDLTPAFSEIGGLLESKKAIKAVFTFGSSGLLAKQIEHGAPFDLFASASGSFVDRTESLGLVVEGSRQVFAIGRLAVWQREDAPVPLQTVSDLANPAIRRIAIANPEHAPYGRAAREALEHGRLWEAMKEKIVFAENVAQAFQFAQTGNVDAAVVAQSLATGRDGRVVPIEPQAHAPIDQTVCILKRARQIVACRQFVEFLLSAEGQAVLQRYGFALP
ncbi:MAG: molybdate ABC transporter substrate-binding protein [Acidimicrobiia bacterium]|nr:molybdate ABC transporter substrate-binding protein [Acidimicrobiia bacterium]